MHWRGGWGESHGQVGRWRTTGAACCTRAAVIKSGPTQCRASRPLCPVTQVTFQHLDCARQVHASFLDTIEQLRTQGRGYLVPRGAPTHGVGHSNGALLLLLIGALFDRPVRSNVVISFNNL